VRKHLHTFHTMRSSTLAAQYGLTLLTPQQKQTWETKCLVTPLKVDKKPGLPFALSQWDELTQTLWIPRGLGLSTYGPPQYDKTTLGTVLSIEPRARFRSTLDASRFQVSACQALLQALLDPSRWGGLLQLPPGTGKTVVICYLLTILLRTLHGRWIKTCIIVPTSTLMHQWPERISEHTQGLKVGMCHGPVFPDPDCDIVIMLIHSAASKVYPPSFYAQFGCVVFDEVHVAGARTFSQALSFFPARYKIGMTGTPKRADGLSQVILWQVGPLLYEPHKLLTDCTLHAPALVRAALSTLPPPLQDLVCWFDVGVWYYEITQKTFGFQVRTTTPIVETSTLTKTVTKRKRQKTTKTQTNELHEQTLIQTLHSTCIHLRWIHEPPSTQKLVTQVTQKLYQGPGKSIENGKKEPIVFLMMRRLVQDKRRNTLICENIAALLAAEPRRHLLVVSRQVTHLQLLYAQLQQPPFNLSTTTQLGLYYQKTKKQTSELHKQVVLGIDVMVTLGLDLASFTGLILTMPFGQLEQLEARLCHRRGRSPPFASVIVDWVDPYGLFDGLGWKRYQYYKKQHYQIKREDIQ